MNLDTRCVHGDGMDRDPYRATVPPIYQTATFRQPPHGMGPYDYSRSGNPTRRAVETQIARLEGGCTAVAFASGMAAVAGVVSLARPGERIVAGADTYGGTYRYLTAVAEPLGIEVRFVDTRDAGAVRAALHPAARLVFVETPSNPYHRITDIREVAAAAHGAGAWCVVDNSLMSPVLQRPLDAGADIVVHSATKFLSGHANLTAGLAVFREAHLASRVVYYQNAAGNGLAPFEAWLLLNGVKTLALRVRRQQRTARRLARILADHPAVREVFYPGLPFHPGRTTHEGQARGPGAVVTFRTRAVSTARHVVAETRLFGTTVSFGAVSSSIERPAEMSHACVPVTGDTAVIPEDLVRLSVGIEHAGDLILDLVRALPGGRHGRASVLRKRRRARRRCTGRPNGPPAPPETVAP